MKRAVSTAKTDPNAPRRGRGRPSIGARPMTPAERLAGFRVRQIEAGKVDLSTLVEARTRRRIAALAAARGLSIGAYLDAVFGESRGSTAEIRP